MDKKQVAKEIASKSVIFGKKIVDFNLFKKQINELVIINYQKEETEDLIYDWYAYFKESVYQTTEDFANFWLEDVTKDSHNYYLKRNN